MLALRLPKHIEESLENLAKKKGRTPAYYARKAIVAMIEDEIDIAKAEAAMAEIRAGGKTYTLDELRVMHPDWFAP